MARIIPWKLPDVQGGSVGGYTPAPTPTPTPLTNYPYDLDNMSLSTEIVPQTAKESLYPITYVYGGVYGLVNISGVKILDSSEVSSVIITVELTAGDVNFTGADSSTAKLTLSDAEFQLEIATLMHSEGGTKEIAGYTKQGMKLFGSDQTYWVNFGNNAAAYPAEMTSTTCTLTVTKLVVYNSNGVALQEWEAE